MAIRDVNAILHNLLCWTEQMPVLGHQESDSSGDFFFVSFLFKVPTRFFFPFFFLKFILYLSHEWNQHA